MTIIRTSREDGPDGARQEFYRCFYWLLPVRRLQLYSRQDMFGQEMEEMVFEEDNQNLDKLPALTAFTYRNSNSYKTPTNLLNFQGFPQPLEMSIDRGIYASNAKLIKKAVVEFLKSCLNTTIQGQNIFHSNFIFAFQSCQNNINQEEQPLESLILNNYLLTQFQKKELLQNFEEFKELSGLVLDLKEQLGKEICQEIVYVISVLLELKIKCFRGLINKGDNSFLPKIQCFWGVEGEEEVFRGSWEVYEDIDYDEINHFAAEGVQDYAMKIYFSQKLKYLTLRLVKCDVKPGVSVADRFATLLVDLSRNIFLGMSGMAQRESDIQQISNELSLTYIEEEHAYHVNLPKKIKTDF